MRRDGYLAQRLTLSVDCLDAPRWTVAAPVAAANDDRAGLETLAGLWAALVEARPQATLFRLTVSFDRFRPTDAVQLELPWHARDGRSRVVRLTAAIDAINRRYGRTLIGLRPVRRARRLRGRQDRLRAHSRTRGFSVRCGWVTTPTAGGCSSRHAVPAVVRHAWIPPRC